VPTNATAEMRVSSSTLRDDGNYKYCQTAKVRLFLKMLKS